jgi:hypothetical protein
LEGTTHLLEIVRHVHLAPLEMGVTADLDGYRWCSHRAYAGLESLDWLNQRPVLELLAEIRAPATAAQTYQQFMSVRREPLADVAAPPGSAPDDSPPRSQLPSDDHFFSWLRRHAGKPPATVTVDQVIQAVAKKMGVDRKRLLSTSRERRLTLTRALIGWHVTKNQIATLTEVSRQLGRDPSSVYTAYARYRAWRPQLFRDSLATILQYLEPDDPARDASAVKKH